MDYNLLLNSKEAEKEAGIQKPEADNGRHPFLCRIYSAHNVPGCRIQR